MPVKMENKTTCLCCGASFSPVRNSRGKFCSLACAAKMGRDLYIQAWLNGEVSGGSRNAVSSHVKAYLFEKQNGRCCECELDEWEGEPIPLSVEHRNGNPQDHSPGNVVLNCLNCHALTSTYKGRNRGKGRLSMAISIGCKAP